MFDKDITIINKYWENEQTGTQTINDVVTPVYTKVMKYKVSHIKGFWSSNESISISGVDLIGSKRTIVRVLYSEEGYVSPASYSGTGWTLKNDDYVVKGGTSIESVSSINSILDTYECLKITNVSVKDYGSSDMWHYEISGE